MIHVDSLSYRYHKARQPAVKNLGFRVGDGEIFGFLGPSGAGKSTTQKVLIGLLRNYSGQVSVFNQDLGSWSRDYFERIGVSFEFPNHFLKLTALENLRYFSALYDKRCHPPENLLEMVGLADAGDRLVSQYSKGMKNRLSIARALLHAPDLIFMDEPTAGLDPVNARRVRGLIKAEQAKGKTIFLTTHDMITADELCNRVAFIVDGEIKLIGPPRDLKLQYGKRNLRVEYLQKQRLECRDFPLDSLAESKDFLDLIKTREIQTMHTLEASLEEVFVEVTGKSLM